MIERAIKRLPVLDSEPEIQGDDQPGLIAARGIRFLVTMHRVILAPALLRQGEMRNSETATSDTHCPRHLIMHCHRCLLWGMRRRPTWERRGTCRKPPEAPSRRQNRRVPRARPSSTESPPISDAGSRPYPHQGRMDAPASWPGSHRGTARRPAPFRRLPSTRCKARRHANRTHTCESFGGKRKTKVYEAVEEISEYEQGSSCPICRKAGPRDRRSRHRRCCTQGRPG